MKTEQNYAGYPEKIKGNQGSRYGSMVSSLRNAAVKTSAPKACYELLARYVRFFYDKHFIVAYQAGHDVDSVVVPTTEASLNQYFKTDRAAALEGRWIRSDSAIQVAIVQKKPGLYE